MLNIIFLLVTSGIYLDFESLLSNVCYLSSREHEWMKEIMKHYQKMIIKKGFFYSERNIERSTAYGINQILLYNKKIA